MSFLKGLILNIAPHKHTFTDAWNNKQKLTEPESYLPRKRWPIQLYSTNVTMRLACLWITLRFCKKKSESSLTLLQLVAHPAHQSPGQSSLPFAWAKQKRCQYREARWTSLVQQHFICFINSKVKDTSIH